MIIGNDSQSLTIITKSSILDVATVLDTPLVSMPKFISQKKLFLYFISDFEISNAGLTKFILTFPVSTIFTTTMKTISTSLSFQFYIIKAKTIYIYGN